MNSGRSDSAAAPVLLAGDIGGTNARFALANPDTPGYRSVVSFACAEHATAADAIEQYLEQFLERAAPGKLAGVCLAAAGPIVDGAVRFTNNPWRIDSEGLADRLGVASLRLINDFEAVALSLPFLGEGGTHPTGLTDGGISLSDDFTVGVLGPGTGLGVAGLLGRDGALFPIVGEGGHTGFAPETARQIEVLEVLRERYERVSQERLLSGPGLVNIYAALDRLHGTPGGKPGTTPGVTLDAAEIFARAQSGEDRIGEEAVKLFFEVLGQAAGNLALALGAFDGIYIAGGIVRRYPGLLQASGFRAAFEHKGRHRSLMERVPTYLVTHDNPGLLGAAYGALAAWRSRAAGRKTT